MRLRSHHRTQAATSCDMEFAAEDLVAPKSQEASAKTMHTNPPGLHHRIDGGVSLISNLLAAPRAGLRGGVGVCGGAWPCLQHTGDITELMGAFGLAETLEGIVHFYFIRQG